MHGERAGWPARARSVAATAEPEATSPGAALPEVRVVPAGNPCPAPNRHQGARWNEHLREQWPARRQGVAGWGRIGGDPAPLSSVGRAEEFSWLLNVSGYDSEK